MPSPSPSSPSPSNSSDIICHDSEPDRQQYWASNKNHLIERFIIPSRSRSCSSSQSDHNSPITPAVPPAPEDLGSDDCNHPISICSSPQSPPNLPSPISLNRTESFPLVQSNNSTSLSDQIFAGQPQSNFLPGRSSVVDHHQSEKSDDEGQSDSGAPRSVLSRFRYQSNSSASSRRSTAPKKICLEPSERSSRRRPTSPHSRSSISSSALSAVAPLEIGYRTLMQLKSCPACENSWTTYKAPKSKLSHIEKCARKLIIDPTDMLRRVDAVLERQDREREGGRNLLDRHLLKKNVEVSVVGVAGTDGEGTEDERRAVQLELLRRQKAGSGQPSPQLPRPAILSAQSASLPASGSRPSGASPSDKPNLRSSVLKAAQLRTAVRNAQVPAAGERSYSLWDLATGDNEFDYDRSSAPLSPTKHNRPSSPDEPWPARSPDGINVPHSQTECDRLSGETSLEDAQFVKPAMPLYETWTRQQLKSESERLGYEDGSEVSTDGLVGRARRGWLDNMGRSVRLGSGDEAIESTRSDSPDRLGADSASQSPFGNDDDQLQIRASGDEDEDYWETQGHWEGAGEDSQPGIRQSVEEEDDYWDAQAGWGAGEDEDVHWAASILGATPSALPGNSQISVRPDYASFSKAELEHEYTKLHGSLVEPHGSQLPPPADLPKTKAAIMKRVIKLWNTVNDQLEDDQERAGKKAKKIKVVKKKLDIKEVNEIMMKIFTDEPSFYLRILRYEPIKISVFEDKIKAVLIKAFETSLALATQANGQEQKADVVVQQTVSSDTLGKWLDWQAISCFSVDPSVSRKRY